MLASWKARQEAKAKSDSCPREKLEAQRILAQKVKQLRNTASLPMLRQMPALSWYHQMLSCRGQLDYRNG